LVESVEMLSRTLREFAEWVIGGGLLVVGASLLDPSGKSAVAIKVRRT